jgi:hypothetical protein
MAFYEGSLPITSTQVEQPFTRDRIGFIPGNLYLSVETASVRFRYGGESPTTGSGHLLAANSNAVFTKTSEIENLKLIAISTSAMIHYTIEGR